jgi:hypothetical protein
MTLRERRCSHAHFTADVSWQAMRARVTILASLLLASTSLAQVDCVPLDEDAFRHLLDRTLSCVAARSLRELDEKPLTPDNFESTYRFVWMGAFAPPMAFRLNIGSDGTGVLTVKTGDDPNRITERVVVVAKAEVDSFTASLDKAHFWTLRLSHVPVGARDGSYWIIEAQVGSKYRPVLRWSPKDGEFREAALLLVKLGGEKMSHVHRLLAN